MHINELLHTDYQCDILQPFPEIKQNSFHFQIHK